MLSLLNKWLLGEMAAPVAAKTDEPAHLRTYYVNAFRCKTKSDGKDACIIGLFDSNDARGIPGLAVANEHYVSVTLLAYYRIPPHPYIVDFKRRSGEVKTCGRLYERIPIISRYKERRLQAENTKAAIEKFTNFEFD